MVTVLGMLMVTILDADCPWDGNHPRYGDHSSDGDTPEICVDTYVVQCCMTSDYV